MAEPKKAPEPIKKLIFRETIRVSSRFLAANTTDKKVTIGTAVSLLNMAYQADDDTQAKRLLSLAKRISREV